jgi:hypothetical protein
MTLNQFDVALQGLYSLTPIAVAVQGLIEQIKADAERYNGSGRQATAKAAPKDDVTVDEVIRQWEILEARLRSTTPIAEPKQEGRTPQTEAPVEPESRAKVDTVPAADVAMPVTFRRDAVPAAKSIDIESMMAEAIQIEKDREQQRAKRKRDDEEALLLVLAQT